MPRVSVILNCFNQAAYVRDAVESVLHQTYRDLELVGVDNGSTDETPAILGSYAADQRVRLVLHQENAAITRRFNEAVSLASGEFISFLYSDDYYLPEKLARQVDAFDRLSPSYGVVYGPAQGYNVVTARRWRYGSIAVSGEILKDMLLRYESGQIDMVSPLTRKKCFERYPFDEDIFAEGEAIFFKIAMRYRFHYIDKPLVVLRDHLSNAGKATRRNADMAMKSLERLENHPDFPAEYQSFLRTYRATLFRNYGWQMTRTGDDMPWARRCFARAFREDWPAAVHFRTFAGLALSILPAAFRARLNTVANTTRRHAHNSVYVKDFGGSIGKI